MVSTNQQTRSIRSDWFGEFGQHLLYEQRASGTFHDKRVSIYRVDIYLFFKSI